jgi:hypothetical protein
VPGLFRHLTIRGQTGAVIWSYHTAAALAEWAITKQEPPREPPFWQLAARVIRADAFVCRQRPLRFTAVHPKGQWCWTIESIVVTGDRLYAVLGLPEQ